MIDIKVSVIVPVYNVENYIRECICSLLKQSLKEIEIIIVNDGSTDKSIECIFDLIEENSNILLINKENGGLSSARNEGLKYAKGEYISFIDSDDYIELDYLETLYKEAKKLDLDIIYGNYTKVYKDKKIIENRNKELFNEEILDGNIYMFKQLSLKDYRMEVWDDLYKKSFLLENNLRFTENLIHEDEDFSYKVLLKAKRVKVIENYGYFYRQRDDSIMNQGVTMKSILSIIFIINNLQEDFKKCDNHISQKVISMNICRLIYALEDKLFKYDNCKITDLCKDISTKDLFKITTYNPNLSKKAKIKFYLLSKNKLVYYYLLKLIKVPK